MGIEKNNRYRSVNWNRHCSLYLFVLLLIDRSEIEKNRWDNEKTRDDNSLLIYHLRSNKDHPLQYIQKKVILLLSSSGRAERKEMLDKTSQSIWHNHSCLFSTARNF